ncbi:MAG: sensor histidine kinase [Saprospiraceae bacterium]
MKNAYATIEAFLHRHTFWIYAAVLLFMDFLVLASVIQNGWTSYIMTFVKLMIVFSPVLLFTWARTAFSKWLPKVVEYLLWGIVFIGFPILIVVNRIAVINFLFTLDQYIFTLENINDFSLSYLLTINLIFILIEIIILLSRYFHFNKNKFAKLDLDRLLLGVIGALAFIFGGVCVIEWVQLPIGQDTNIVFVIWKFCTFAAQIFLILLGYFSFYYLNRHVWIPRFLQPKGLVYYAAASLAGILVIYPLMVLIFSRLPVILELELGVYYSDDPTIFGEDFGVIPILITLFTLPIIVSNQWFQQHSRIADLQKQKSATELNLLKQQINPHFFFNTLNNLYALSITQDKQTPEVIMQLSELMRYVIYKGKQEFVSLAEEIKYIEDYIQLQQIRLHQKLDIQITKEIEDERILIPPLLFITFVENAFKHGIEPAAGEGLLHLHIQSSETELWFTCENSVEDETGEVGGVGLHNLRRRLELRFPEKHELRTLALEKEFRATLNIQF